jgi:ligand-binding SRPBCC domain-containing protein
MPQFEARLVLSRSLLEAFDFFRRPANLVRISPPELHLRLVEGPERIELGSRVVLQGRRWGVPQRIVSEITAFEEEVLFRDEQREGPFGKWSHTHRFEQAPEGTRVTDQIDYEPPTGLLGLILNTQAIERDLQWIFSYRAQKVQELLGPAT